jgi:TRAP-type C4-dicarboxylate transport system permease small subunit
MLAVVAFILLVYGYSLFSRRLSATSPAIPQSFAVAVITLVLGAPGLASGSTSG